MSILSKLIELQQILKSAKPMSEKDREYFIEAIEGAKQFVPQPDSSFREIKQGLCKFDENDFRNRIANEHLHA